MRLTYVLTAALMATVTTAGGHAASTTNADPTEQAIIEMSGGRLSKVLATFGAPQDIRPSLASKTQKDAVLLDYGAYGFQVREKIVRVCYFWPQWAGTVKGVKIGDTRAQVVQVLGKHQHTERNADGVDDYAWELKDIDSDLWVVFGKDDKVVRIQVELN
jgi:hypothetical protein